MKDSLLPSAYWAASHPVCTAEQLVRWPRERRWVRSCSLWGRGCTRLYGSVNRHAGGVRGWSSWLVSDLHMQHRGDERAEGSTSASLLRMCVLRAVTRRALADGRTVEASFPRPARADIAINLCDAQSNLRDNFLGVMRALDNFFVR